MNSLICFLTVFHAVKLFQRRWFVSRKVRRLIFLGIFLPLSDYILRIILGELWFYSGNLVFHSFFYQMLFWSVLALLYWVKTREIESAIVFFFPVLGLFFYFLFSLLSTESLRFFTPFSDFTFHLGWINAGYFVPTVLALFLWGIKRWSEMSVENISRISLSVFAVFLITSGIVWNNAIGDMEKVAKGSELIRIKPSNSLHTEWDVTSYQNRVFKSGKYHFVQGWQGKMESVEAFGDFNLAQNVLLDPYIRSLYLKGFKNPILDVEIQNEVLKITIRELNPSIELLWLKQIQILKNDSGQIIDTTVNYGTFI